MNEIAQEKNSLLELVLKEMERRGWKQKDLVQASKVNQATVSRFLRNKQNTMELENVFGILTALGLIGEGDSNHRIIPIESVKYDPGNADLHDALEKILRSHDLDARKTLDVVMEGLMLTIEERRGQARDIKEIRGLLRELLERET